MRRITLLTVLTLLAVSSANAQFVAPGASIPVVANLPGLNATDWRTDVSVVNLGETETSIRLLLLPEIRNGVPGFRAGDHRSHDHRRRRSEDHAQRRRNRSSVSPTPRARCRSSPTISRPSSSVRGSTPSVMTAGATARTSKGCWWPTRPGPRASPTTISTAATSGSTSRSTRRRVSRCDSRSRSSTRRRRGRGRGDRLQGRRDAAVQSL